MDPALLKRWSALTEIPDEDVNNIAYMVVYGQRESYLTGRGRSVMYITRDTREVYGAGWNSLIGWTTKGLPIAASGNIYLGSLGDGAVKVSILDGVKVDKLAVGWHVGAALAQDQTIHVWGTRRVAQVLSKGTIVFHIYSPGNWASCCPTNNYESSDVYGVKLCKCPKCGEYAIATPETSNNPTKSCVLYKFYQMECPKCELTCASVTIGKHEVNYCQNCNILPEPHEYVATTEAITRQISLPGTVKVKDLSCGKSFVALTTWLNDVLIIGSIGNDYYEGTANIANHVLNELSCGGEHLAVITSLGELYTSGRGDKGQLGYDWAPHMGFVTFRKVPLQGPVNKVCCGHSTTVCLMADGSVMCFGAGYKLTSSDNLVVNRCEDDFLVTPTKLFPRSNFTDIVNYHLSDIYWAKTDASMVYTWGHKNSQTHHPKLLFGVTSLMVALANEQSCVSVEVGVNSRIINNPTSKSAALFGNRKFSDLTLQLADGEFPAHKLILYNSSTYFRQTLNQNPDTPVFNMTCHNPTAYKSLLMYFYDLQVGNLQPADLFDLYILAENYKETDIVEDAYQQLKAALNDETVLTLLQKSNELNNSEILKLCVTYVNTPRFRQKLISLISNNMENTMAVLRVEANQ